MTIDGNKLRDLRMTKGMSQEKLGLLSNLNKRTIQRAERGDAVSIETVAFIADALEVEPQTIRAKQLELFKQQTSLPEQQLGEVILIPVSRGTRLVNTLTGAFHALFEYDAEPMEDTVDLLEETAAVLNAAWSNPWELSFYVGDDGNGDAWRIRLQAKANRLLQGLAEKGIKIFLGTYESWVQFPSLDPHEGVVSISRNQPKEKVTKALVVVSDEDTKHLSRTPKDHEIHTKPIPKPAQDFSQDFDDEIPF